MQSKIICFKNDGVVGFFPQMTRIFPQISGIGGVGAFVANAFEFSRR
jgi:hypothetical protein